MSQRSPRYQEQDITGDELLEAVSDLFEQGLITVAEPIGDDPDELPRIDVTPLGREVAQTIVRTAGGSR